MFLTPAHPTPLHPTAASPVLSGTNSRWVPQLCFLLCKLVIVAMSVFDKSFEQPLAEEVSASRLGALGASGEGGAASSIQVSDLGASSSMEMFAGVSCGGLLETEAVLRVEGDAKPVLLCGLEATAGAQWIRLDKRNIALGNFLGGLRGSAVFEKISCLLREKVRNLQEEFIEPHVSDSPPARVDKASLLGLDAEEETTPRKRSRRCRLDEMKAASRVVPPFVEVTCSMAPGEAPWAFEALTASGKTGRKCVAIKVTSRNMGMLRRLVDLERNLGGAGAEEGEASKRKGKFGAHASGREPRGGKGNREYWSRRRDKWVVKALVQGGPCGKRRYRALTRQATPIETPASVHASGSAGL